MKTKMRGDAHFGKLTGNDLCIYPKNNHVVAKRAPRAERSESASFAGVSSAVEAFPTKQQLHDLPSKSRVVPVPSVKPGASIEQFCLFTRRLLRRISTLARLNPPRNDRIRELFEF